MACTYCFAKARGGHRSDGETRFASGKYLSARLTRVSNGVISSVLDEFLSNRVPLQLGGMSDPFTRASVRRGVTKAVLEALCNHDYPTIVSTKGSLKDILSHVDILARGNFYMRVSMAASTFKKQDVEPGTPSENEVFEIIAALAGVQIPVCLRLQPIFPYSEERAASLLLRARAAGAVAASLEYLKVPKERSSAQFSAIDELYGGRLANVISAFGAISSGREIAFSLKRRKESLLVLKAFANTIGLRVGLAENELLHYGDLPGCCNGASGFLRQANDFRYNVPAALRTASPGSQITLADFQRVWSPSGNIGSYFNSRSRLGLLGNHATWTEYFRRQWCSPRAHFNPTFFDGVAPSTECDDEGLPIYDFNPDKRFAKLTFPTAQQSFRPELPMGH